MPGLDITPRLAADRPIIQSYGNGGFRVSGEAYRGSILVFSDQTVAWAVERGDDVTFGSLAALTGQVDKAEILLVGCGPRYLPPPSGLGEQLRSVTISLEWMDTGAACRTFNVLQIDGRRVAAALIAVP